jgi:hypothetical protein
MFCRNCGKEIPDPNAFCGNCGFPATAQPSIPGTSATKVAIGVFAGMIAVIVAMSAYANIGGVFIICGLLAILAILVGVGAFKNYTR